MRTSRSRSTTITTPTYNNELTDQNTPARPSSPMPAKHDTTLDAVLDRFQRLSCTTEPRTPLSPLGPPFVLDDLDMKPFHTQRLGHCNALDLSPQSSVSSRSSLSSASSVGTLFDAFVRTQSRVVRCFNLPPAPHALLSSVLFQTGLDPATMWVLRVPTADLDVWMVFQTHAEACAALSLSSSRMSVAPALESDLEPLSMLKRFELGSNAMPAQVYMSGPQRVIRPSMHVLGGNTADHHAASGASTSAEEYTMSSNPPNPRTSFRMGDWIRNVACIGCGCARSTAPGHSATAHDHNQHPYHGPQYTSSTPRSPLSPRFAAASNMSFQPPYPQSSPAPAPRQVPGYMQPVLHLPLPAALATVAARQASSPHPLLTPSGRAFAVGGKVQNVSTDPLSPCIMYWPDNEPLPEQGQIRPGSLTGITQPPILNTGNKGPISHQPGDWICQKCNYLNWRRRKVCQTCLPYAEGNGDSVSASVQAERIALLTSALVRSQSPAALPHHVGRSQSATPAQVQRPFVNVSPPQPIRAPVHRSQSHIELGSHYMQTHPIYQTAIASPQRQPRLPSPLQRHALTFGTEGLDLHAPAPLLPSFLQDIVQSPTLSPSSTSSADLSLEEYEDSLPSSTKSTFSQSGADSVNASPLANIWRLDGEESRCLKTGFLGSASSSRNSSLERLRLHSS
ncbi:unnamed protein product [Mycena citricolor]|uniref:RanBP2-type domain-containing protein n=1 Tax=Mycena citricolor TaxID=2018698 RepID=A0AAD2Q3F1_9AGAR|nr:unnamed protein product [Mycena citricolor]